MLYHKHITKFPLDNYIESITFIEGNNKGIGLPKTNMSLVFNLEDSFRWYMDRAFKEHKEYKRHWVSGLQTKPTNVECYGLSRMLVVQFKALGAFYFLNDPLHYYTDDFVTLDNVFNNEADEIWEQLQESKSLNEKFLVIENFLMCKFLSTIQPNKKLISCIGILMNNNVNLSINKICKQLNISRKHLNDLSKKYTGVSPKMLSSLNRLQTTLKTISSTSSEKLTDVAYNMEYFDQAHFINDFKRFTGLKPTEYANMVKTEQSLKIIPHFIPIA